MSDKDFLSRWSQRKRLRGAAAAAPAAGDAAPDAGTTPAAADAGPVVTEAEAAAMSDAQVLARLGLPDPATLGAGADFRAFLRAGVPQRLQRLALRRLWRVTPAQAALDGLVDYAEDYTDAAKAVQTLATTYRVGRGLGAHVEALARAEAEATRRAAAPEEPVPADDGPDTRQDETAGDTIPEAIGHPTDDGDIAAQHDDFPTRTPKPGKMKFRFNEV